MFRGIVEKHALPMAIHHLLTAFVLGIMFIDIGIRKLFFNWTECYSMPNVTVIPSLAENNGSLGFDYSFLDVDPNYKPTFSETFQGIELILCWQTFLLAFAVRLWVLIFQRGRLNGIFGMIKLRSMSDEEVTRAASQLVDFRQENPFYHCQFQFCEVLHLLIVLAQFSTLCWYHNSEVGAGTAADLDLSRCKIWGCKGQCEQDLCSNIEVCWPRTNGTIANWLIFQRGWFGFILALAALGLLFRLCLLYSQTCRSYIKTEASVTKNYGDWFLLMDAKLYLTGDLLTRVATEYNAISSGVSSSPTPPPLDTLV